MISEVDGARGGIGAAPWQGLCRSIARCPGRLRLRRPTAAEFWCDGRVHSRTACL